MPSLSTPDPTSGSRCPAYEITQWFKAIDSVILIFTCETCHLPSPHSTRRDVPADPDNLDPVLPLMRGFTPCCRNSVFYACPPEMIRVFNCHLRCWSCASDTRIEDMMHKAEMEKAYEGAPWCLYCGGKSGGAEVTVWKESHEHKARNSPEVMMPPTVVDIDEVLVGVRRERRERRVKEMRWMGDED